MIAESSPCSQEPYRSDGQARRTIGGTLGEGATAFYDLFRLEDGLIVENQDVIAPMPGPDAAQNEAGKF